MVYLCLVTEGSIQSIFCNTWVNYSVVNRMEIGKQKSRLQKYLMCTGKMHLIVLIG